MRSKIKEEINFRYIIRNPSQDRGAGKRISFKIEKRTFDEGTGEVKESRLAVLTEERQDALDSINRRFKDHILDFERARAEVEEVVETLYKDAKAIRAAVFNTANQKVLKEYLDACYTQARRRKMSAYDSARNESERAIESLGTLSIQSATPKEIQNQVDKAHAGSPNRQRRAIFKLRAILQWLRPSESWKHLLTPDSEEQKLVRYLTDEEFAEVLPHLEGTARKALAQVCFHLGCRVGEAVALTSSDLREARNVVLIAKQITKEGHQKRTVKAKTKNKRIREAFIFPEGVAALKAWIKIKDAFTTDDRRRLGQAMREACQKVFSTDENKHLVWHDLRHCYAIRLLDKGLSVNDIADMIGDSAVVAKKHYIGFIVSDARMDRIRSKVLGK